MNRFPGPLTPALPFAISLALSLSTIGSHVFWQDSGLFLAAVKDLGILYPPGFVLYLLLCKTWTLLLAFLDFTLAVHLFSATCTAAASAFIALAARDLLRSRGSLFRVLVEPDDNLAGPIGAAVGSMAAGGFTFWFTGIYAKGYALYYTVLALLLWRMIRADDSRRPRDFTIVAALIGLAWAAHPSSVCLALPLVLFVVAHRDAIGWKGIAWRSGLATAVALLPSIVALPILTSRHPVTALGDPASLGEVLEYVTGERFMGRKGAFGYDSDRVASFGQFLWEEMLGVGLSLLAVGFIALAKFRRRLLIGVLAWVVPYSVVAILFQIEGQHDCWFVAAWLPLHAVVAIGLHRLAGGQAPRAAAAVIAGAAGASLVWAVIANHGHLNQRRYELADIYGKVHLQHVDPNAIVILNSDDSLSICGYLQQVRGERPDVVLVTLPFLGLSLVSPRNWYDQNLLSRYPFLRMPDYAGMRRRFPEARPLAAHEAAFLHANADGGRPIFMEAAPPAALLPEGYEAIPAGVLWKLVLRGRESVQPTYWDFPIEPDNIQLRRERGVAFSKSDGHFTVHAEAYETRLITLLLRARYMLGDWNLKHERPAEGLPLLESVRALDPRLNGQGEFLFSLGKAYHSLGQDQRAEPLLRKALTLDAKQAWNGWAFYYLGEIVEKANPRAAKREYEAASAVAGGDAALKAAVEKKLRPASDK
jgi:tetratricopeptide (TPR) repeat protein